ncbi:MAG TPA: chemotaxis protein CheW [Vicinamibacteria bacterium]|nr:chemotaxis protein CheW [Vicinamibacteria bacterium]
MERVTGGASDRPAVDWQEAYAALERVGLALDSGGVPPPDEVLRILTARARALARPPEEASPLEDALEVLVFSAGGERFAIETEHVAEVVRCQDLTAVPCTPPVVLGVMNHRGRIVAALDLRRLFDLPCPDVTPSARIIVVRSAESPAGILADAVTGITRIGAHELARPPLAPAGRRAGIRGVTADVVSVLDLAALFRDARIGVNEEAG